MSNVPSNEDVQTTIDIATGIIAKLGVCCGEKVTVEKTKLKGICLAAANLGTIVLNLRKKIAELKKE